MQFPRVVSLVLKDSFVVVQAEIYNRRNEKQKVYTVRRLEQSKGIWTVMDSRDDQRSREHPHRAHGRADRLQRRPDGGGLQPPGARAPPEGRAGSEVHVAAARRVHLSLALPAVGDRNRRRARCSLRAPNITNIDNDITAWFSRDDPVYRDYERFREEFAGTRTFIVALKADSADRLFSRQMLDYIEQVTGDIERVDTVQRVDSLATATIVDSVPDGLDVRPLIDLARHAGRRRRAPARDGGRPHSRRPGVGRRHRHRARSSASTRTASTPSAPASSSRSTTSSIRGCRRASAPTTTAASRSAKPTTASRSTTSRSSRRRSCCSRSWRSTSRSARCGRPCCRWSRSRSACCGRSACTRCSATPTTCCPA